MPLKRGHAAKAEAILKDFDDAGPGDDEAHNELVTALMAIAHAILAVKEELSIERHLKFPGAV